MKDADFEAARLTVRLGAIVANYKTVQRLAGPAGVAAVVKADAYGLGAGVIAPMLAGARCDTFFVARLEEGIALRKVLPDARIFILDGAPPDSVPALIEHRLTPVLNSLAEIAGWGAAAHQTRQILDAAIHIDTGMNRLGLPGYELATLAAEARKRLAFVRVVLWMSHLACADDAGSAMNATQLERFRMALAMLPPAPASLANSAGVLLGKNYSFDLVRPGIALYGANPQNKGENPFAVTAVLTAQILQLRRIDKGEGVGYGATLRTKRPTMLATLGLGYADGVLRAASGKGFAVLAGQRVPIAGRVSMDLTILDVTDIAPDALRLGAEVEFFGDTISLDEAARAAGTVPYEILTSMRGRVPHHYTESAT
ncbi:MAG TPA: alanine racemase [Rhizomicrobium sp.]